MQRTQTQTQKNRRQCQSQSLISQPVKQLPLFTHSSHSSCLHPPLLAYATGTCSLSIYASVFASCRLQVPFGINGREGEGEGELCPAPCLRISISNSSRLLFPSLSASLPLPHTLSAGNLYEELCVCSTFFAASRLICFFTPPALLPSCSLPNFI